MSNTLGAGPTLWVRFATRTLTKWSEATQVYEALFFMAIRDFKKAAELFLESIATFTTYVRITTFGKHTPTVPHTPD